MSSQHFRSASATERKPATGASRVDSKRAREHERNSLYETGSPLSIDEMKNATNYDDGTWKYERKVNGTDRTREKTAITTTETYLTKRSQLKGGTNFANRSPVERRPRSSGSPVRAKEPKEAAYEPTLSERRLT